MPPSRFFAPSNLIDHSQISGESGNLDEWFNTANESTGAENTSIANVDASCHSRSSTKLESPGAFSTLCTEAKSGYHERGNPPVVGEDAVSEYRSVIDDLTIENRRLRRRRLKRRKARRSTVSPDRIFELKAHGLSPRVKRDLEETLRLFSSRIATPQHHGIPSSPTSPPNDSLAKLKAGQAGPSMVIADSGYGSLVASHQPSSVPASSTHASHGLFLNDRKLTNALDVSRARERSVRSYLHGCSDIPEGLFPRTSAVGTEEARKQLVVKQLEQVFIGRRATAGGHQQPLQQQEVSQLAASDDRLGRGSGVSDLINPSSVDDADGAGFQARLDSSERGFLSSIGCTEPRPTRPLDLDPQWAQIPAENFQYMRHLGLAISDCSDRVDDRGSGWVYLNLLMSMAQVHMINVTTKFVKHAISDCSQRLELSIDGRKVRWRGLGNASCAKANAAQRSSVAMQQRDSASNCCKQGSEMRVSSAILAQTPLKRQASEELSQDKRNVGHDPSQSHADDDSLKAEPCSEPPLALTPAVSIFQGRHKQHDYVQRAAVETNAQIDGPVTFYKDVSFFSDLSGDKLSSLRTSQVRSHHSTPSRALGANVSDRKAHIGLGHSRKTQGGPAKTSKACLVAEDLETPGIGGVRPADNFLVTVKRKQMKPPLGSKESETRTTFDTFDSTFRPSTCSPDLNFPIIDAKLQMLEPSPVPPPTFFPSCETSDSASYFGNDASEYISSKPLISLSSSPIHHSCSPSSAISSGWRLKSVAQEESGFDVDISQFSESAVSKVISRHKQGAETGSDGEINDIEDDQSLDLLTAARAADPTAVQIRETEYDVEIAERLVDSTPARSSAVTFAAGVATVYHRGSAIWKLLGRE
ncbi:MAG: hypothetical protein M1828_006836 [Chrysothrix sp. TS-e1954]|nr:MAG: hypothetical protein M1828_006836 [Chrysothrix sp. TS-e1954]